MDYDDRDDSRDNRDGDRRRDEDDRERGYGNGQNNNNGEHSVANNEGMTTIYIRNLSFRADELSLRRVFEKYGPIISTEVVREPGTNTSRGFGFVKFENPSSAQNALELNGQDIEGRNARVELARRTSGHPKTPGKYLGPPSARVNNRGRGDGYDRRDSGRGGRRSRSRSGGRRDRSFDRHPPAGYRYDDRPRDDRRRSRSRSRSRDRRPPPPAGRGDDRFRY